MSKTAFILGAICTLIIAALSFAGGWFTRKLLRPDKTRTEIVTDTVWRWERDTIYLADEKPAGSVIIKVPVVERDTITRDIVLRDTLIVRDSAIVEVPIVQRTYTGEDYRAVVQGYQPELVSIDIRVPDVLLAPAKHKWWTVTVGPQLGYGLTPAGWEPYAGLGVTFGLSF